MFKLILSVVVLAVVVAAQEEEEINYDFIFEKMETVEGSEQYCEYNYTMEKLSEYNFKLSGNFFTPKELNNDFGIVFTLSRAEVGSEEFEEMMHISKPLCEYMKTIYRMYFYESVKDISNFPHFDECPLPGQKEYWIKEYLFEGEGYKAFTRDGHFKIEFYLTKDGANVAGAVTTMTVKPVEK
ncbi:uncharacterized protein LOC120423532 [Culex pipiens pallens]|uniref:uncharacterized protein LOC120423532 n=1 Tax=Culex pipiens pallens TaxID=42434 RepID=UPI001952C5F3|nr:uncharacterized protein LOC120423532 [Culex pipiens pallens]